MVDRQEVAESIGRLNNTLDMLDELDREATPRPRLRRIPNGAGIEESAPTGASVPPPEEGITVLVDAIAVFADTAEGHAHGEVSEEDDEARMEEEESPRSRWRRYVQSGQDEVSEPDEWADIHCGPSTPISTPRRQRSRSRETPMCTQSTPMPRAMQKVIAYRRDQRLAGERGEAMVRHAESEQERRGVRQAGGKRGSKGSASSSMMATTVSIGATANDNKNHFADSYSIAQCFDMGMVPRDDAAFDDYCRDLIMQGMGPETILVHNCRELNQIIAESVDPMERVAMQRPPTTSTWIDGEVPVEGPTSMDRCCVPTQGLASSRTRLELFR